MSALWWFVVLGVVVGYVVAAIRQEIDFQAVGSAAWIGLPEFHAPEITPQFWALLPAFLPVVLVLVAFAETGLLIGFLIPGDSIVFTAGVLVAAGAIDVPIGVALVAVLLAATAVVTLSVGLGAAPWISLTLALTFALYGVVKKALPLGPVQSVTAEVALLAPLAVDAPPCPVPREHARLARWVRPELVAEVEFTAWTREGRLRHPSYKGLREDKDANTVVREGPDQPEQ